MVDDAGLEGEEEIDFSSFEAPADVSFENAPARGNRFTRSRNGVNGYSIFPLWVVREFARVRASKNVVLLAIVLLQRMKVRNTSTVLLTAAIWAEIGSPSKMARQTALQHLRRVPGVLKLEERHKGYTRYQVSLGEMWNDGYG